MSAPIQPTTTTLPAPVQQMREQLPALLESNLPLLEKWSQKAHALLDSIESVDTDEEIEDGIAKLAGVKQVYDASYEKRKQMSDITDAFKDIIMEFERPFNPDAKAKNRYNEKKKLIEAAQQRKHDRIREEQAAQARKKEVENFKVDLKARILSALTNIVTETITKADDYARELFATLEPENFDSHAEQFKRQKPKLRQETYDKCFVVPTDMIERAKQYLQGGDFTVFVQEIQQDEPHEKWNLIIQEKVSPVLNEWRARIPDLKAECLAKASASAEEKVRLDEERKKRDEEEQKRRQDQLEQDRKAQEARIQESANLDKMANNFAEQAASQGLDSVGKTKLVLKFTDPKLAPKGFLEMVYQCMSHPEFAIQMPGFQKRDHKTKKLMVDEKNRPVYPEMVQAWIDFWLEHCDGNISGTSIFEDSKVTIRK